MMIKRGFFVLATLCVGLSCTTATDDDVNGTILETLNTFVDVWNSGDVEAYENLLDEGFTFYFEPEDVGYHDIPESWGLDEEITAYTNLFEYIGAQNVDVTLDLEGVTEPEGDVDTYTVTDIPYDVSVRDETADPEPVTYRAMGQLDMELSKVNGAWVITDWWDRVTWRLPGISECTWGEIKACFS